MKVLDTQSLGHASLSFQSDQTNGPVDWHETLARRIHTVNLNEKYTVNTGTLKLFQQINTLRCFCSDVI